MRKVLLLLLMCAVCYAAPTRGGIIVRIAMTVASTDITNMSKVTYNVYFDVTDGSIAAEGSVDDGIDLCDSERFVKRVGEYTCRKPIRYHVVDVVNDADIIISDHNGYDLDHVLSVCTDDFDGCDVVIGHRKVDIDRDGMKMKGFVPDPTLE